MKVEKEILLIHKVISGEASKKEAQKLVVWMEKSEDNRKFYEEISFVWFIGGENVNKKLLANNNEVSKNKLFERIESDSSSKVDLVKEGKEMGNVIRFKKYLSIAAMFLLLIAALFTFKNFNNSNNTINQFSNLNSNTVNLVDLADNSRVWMDEGTEINSKITEKERRIILNGNAFFEVEKDKQHPFVIEVNNHLIKVIGTSFQVYTAANGNVGVNVYSGVVEFRSPLNKKLVLKRGEGAIFNKKTNSYDLIFENEFTLNSKYNYLAFNNVVLREVFTRLEKNFNVNITIDCNRISDMVGYTSPQHVNDNIEDYFSTIEKLYNLEVEKVTNKHYNVKCK